MLSTSVHAGEGAAQLETYVSPDGEALFALSLTPSDDLPVAAPRDVVVLFDTSASQTGVYRTKALTALETLLAGLGPQDRVKLMAVDLNAVPLCDDFVAANSPEMQAAREKLAARIPLGSTDLARALSATVNSFAHAGAGRTRAAIYLGDGMSTANLLENAEFLRVVRSMTAAQIPLSSYAIGPRVESHLLAVLANQTGGNLAVMRDMAWPDDRVSAERANQENHRNAAEVGKFLAGAVQSSVIWPRDVEWPAELKVYPTQMPPLRSDRDTVVIGSGSIDAPLNLKMVADVEGRQEAFSWQAAPVRPNPDNAYLAQLVDAARHDGGLNLPTVGSRGLQEARRMVNSSAAGLTKLAQHAVATGNVENARMLAEAALRRDPENPVARVIQRSGSSLVGATVAPTAAPADLRLVKQPAAGGDGGLLDSVPEGAFLDSVEQQNRIISQIIQTEVEAELESARDRMATNPEGVINDLKLKLAHVQRVPELDADLRAQLVDQIESALKEASRREVERDEEMRLAQEAVAAARERKRLVDRLNLNQQKAKQLMQRFDSLMAEGRYREAEEGIGPEVAALLPENGLPESAVPVAAIRTARFARYHRMNEETATARYNNFVDTLQQVEVSSIPFPDEPPVVYPDAPVWEELTFRRKKYASVDLKKRGGAEERIGRALDESTSFEFIETPLRDVVEYLRDLHDIEIQIDQRSLDDVGIGTETPITRSLKGISLRSALRLMLRELDLTYVIRDEVLLVTTPEEVENHLTTKVYPVADLVIPIPESGFQGGFGGLGGFGGNQGAGGGQGFGQGGGGGGNGGFGFGGGGGGQQGGGLF
jgi:uncharacterized membrane protein YgcG